MATEKRYYELKANTNTVSFFGSDGKEIRLEADKVYATGEPSEINDLEAHPNVKAAEKPSKKDGS